MARPLWRGPIIEVDGTQTFAREIVAWSVGILSVLELLINCL